MTVSDRIVRRAAPRAIVALSRVDGPARVAASTRRRLGRRGRVELYFAFDDPCSAVAVLDLLERIRGRGVDLALRPVVARGIADDPSVARKREHAIADARRLFARREIVLGRGEPIAAADTAFLAQWVAAARPSDATRWFCEHALRALWIEGDEHAADPEAMRALWMEATGVAPSDGTAAVARNEHAMRRRGAYDTPSAWVHGHLYFAHDRLEQIGEWLDTLGFTQR